jgi:Domain of unknown function (DUF4286)
MTTEHVLYIVTAEIDESDVAAHWLQWIKGGHLQAVMAGGASNATVYQTAAEAGAPVRIEVHYRFGSTDGLQHYLNETAPRLRAEGLAAFPPASGVRLSRRILHCDSVFE